MTGREAIAGALAWIAINEGDTMINHTTTYTAEDFAKARFAEHEFWGVAARAFPMSNCPWFLPHADGRRSDDEMVISGWSPVREADDGVTLHTVKVAQANAERKRQKLLDHIASLEAIVRRRNDQIERQENQIAKLTDERDAHSKSADEMQRKMVEAHAAASPLRTVTLEHLESAWAWGEVPNVDSPIREGDTLIIRNGGFLGGYFVRPSHETHDFELEAEGSIRILSRAPRREPWADLADDLAEVLDVDARRSEELARDLHNGGWRKGGDDDE